MALTESELKRFYAFAVVMIDNHRVSSLEDCLRLWHEDREFAETVAAIKTAEIESAAGLSVPIQQVEAKLRSELGLPPRQPAT
jgi:hypothetical protein